MFTKRHLGLAAAALLMTACNTTDLAQQLPLNQNNALLPQNVTGFSAQSAAKQTIQFKWSDRHQLADLAGSGMDLFGVDRKTSSAKARVSAQELQALQARRIPFQVVVEPRMDTRGGLLPGYMTYSQMLEKLQNMAKQYPSLVTLEDVGDTFLKAQGKNNHEIWSISITNKQLRGQKPTVMYTAGVHARELAPVELTMKLAEELTSKYGKDQQITDLVNNREIIILPMVNVDGRVMVEQGNTWQRKNANGVDVNRNFDSHWNYQGLNVPSSWTNGLTSPSSETYSGKAPASEPETQAVQGMYTRKKINMSMDIHAYGEMFFWPLGYSDQPIPEVPFYKNLFANSFKKIGYEGGTSLELLYATTGTTDDYGYVKHKAFSMGLEVGQSFRPSYQEVEQMWQKTRSSWLTMINASGSTGR